MSSRFASFLPWRWRGPRRVWSLMAAIAVVAVPLASWRWLSPERRWESQLRPGRPRIERLTAMQHLAGELPEWERPRAFEVSLLAARDLDPGIRGGAANVIAEHGGGRPGAIEAVLRLMSDPDRRVRAGAIMALPSLAGQGKEEDELIFQGLRGALEDPDPDARFEAIRSLIRIERSMTAVPELLQLARGGDEVKSRDALAFLVNMRTLTTDLGPALRRMLANDSPWLKLIAAHGLILIGRAEEARRALRGLAGDDSERVRRAAVRFLDAVEDPAEPDRRMPGN